MHRLLTGISLAVATSAAANAQEVRVEFRPVMDEVQAYQHEIEGTVPSHGWQMMTAEDGGTYWVAPDVLITNADIERAEVEMDAVRSRPVIEVFFATDGGKKFSDYTRDNLGSRVAIIFDGVIVSVPRIHDMIVGGSVQISNISTIAEAERIARGIVAKE